MDKNRISPHYGRDYFAWQKTVGEFGGWANITKFSPYVRDEDTVLDFGCGGGFLLKNLSCKRRIGIEANDAAILAAKRNNVETYKTTDQVANESIDVIISNNALEHTLYPLDELRLLFQKLKKGGKIVFIVPCESISNKYKPHDINHHLYSWSPMCIGNLFREAGFSVLESTPYIHKWPPNYVQVAKLGGRRLFEIACRIYGKLERSWFQVRIVGQKPDL